ncbi:MAG: hypothetical protein AB7O57_01440 [Hyphomicrobiaceae bacterium]
MILRALGRLVMVPLGLLLAAFAAIAVLLSLGLEMTTQTLASHPANGERIEVLMDLGFGLLGVLAAASIVPALLVVVVGEVARIRSMLYYVAGGGAALALLPWLARWGGIDQGPSSARVLTVLATAGFGGGFVYWLVAGRRA